MAKAAAARGQSPTLTEFLEADMPLVPLPTPMPKEPDMGDPFENVGWLTAASHDSDALQVLVDAGASKYDQRDKDLALASAARSGQIDAVRILIAYGANPNADLSKLLVTGSIGNISARKLGAGSVLISAATSGNPEVVREILRYHPNLEERDEDGRTALFAAGGYQYRDVHGARVECVRLLVEAGADVNPRDNEGDTPLHETFLTDVEEELLKLGADVNARNDDGETPIFTTVNDDAIALFIEHGADLTIRNNDGKTAIEAAEKKGPQRQDALLKAIESSNQTQ
jgi:ankyrin repeat protein